MVAFDDRRTKRRQLLSRISVCLVLVMLIVGETAWMHLNHLVEEGLFIFGILLTGVGMVGRAWSLAYVVGNKNLTLIREGPYSLCRNPLYFFSFVAGLGVAFCTETLTIPAILAMVFFLMYRNTILQEEGQLRELFGAEFEAYCRVTPRFWPSFRNFTESATLQIAPQFFRRGVVSLFYFMVVIGLTEFIEALHEAGMLPTLIWIY